MNKNYKEQILQLNSEGKDYREIKKILNCSLGTISYHLSNKTKIDTRRNRKKNKAKNAKLLRDRAGGKCNVCGYNKYFGALEFHHLDPKGKKGTVIQLLSTHSLAAASEEAKKCILLCANCHREIEAGVTKL